MPRAESRPTRRALLGLVLVAFAVVAGGCRTRGGAPEPVGPVLADVAGRTWNLTAWTGAMGTAVTFPEDAEASIRVELPGRVSGKSFVNRYFGTVGQPSDGVLAWGDLGLTRMAGPPALMDLENRFLADLRAATVLEVEGRTLVLRAPTGAPRLEFRARR